MKVTIYKNTNFGNNDLVWNVPHPDYNFTVHEKQEFNNVNMRFPLLTTRIIVQGEYDFNTAFYDYMIIEDGETKYYYFISGIVADRNTLLFSVIPDVLTIHNMLVEPVSGTIIRKHDTNLDETRFDYPTALNVEANYEFSVYDVVGYQQGVERFLESAVDLTNIKPSVDIKTGDGTSIVIPTLPKPSHATEYRITPGSGEQFIDDNRALTLYKADLVSDEVLNTVRGLSGDGAISDSYTVPSEAISVTANGAEVTRVLGRFVSKRTRLKLETDFELNNYQPRNKAVEGMLKVSIMSMQEKTIATYPAWDLKESMDDNNYLKVVLWCDPKPSGAPFCAPDQLYSLYPLNNNEGIIGIATLEAKSVRGGSWIRRQILHESSRGEIFSTIETQMQRERADYEKKVAMQQLTLSQKERDIRIAQQDYNYEASVATNIIGAGASLLSKDFGGLVNQGKVAFDNAVQQNFTQQMRALQEYELETEKQLINMAHSNNLRNLDTMEAIRRISPSEVAFQADDSLGGYDGYNSFAIYLLVPDVETLKAKDIEYSKYGYPVYETVENFVMLEHLRTNHTVYQFDSPLINIGGKNGDMIREVLQGGIRILSKPYTAENILNNPKIGEV